MSWLTKYLGIGSEPNDRLDDGVEEVKTVTEFLGDVAEKVPDLTEKAADLSDRLPDLLSNAIEVSAPWLTAGADAVGEALPPIKAILSLAKFLTRETDPYALGLLAFSLAYESALLESANEIASGPDTRNVIRRPATLSPTRAILGEPEKPEAFRGFQLNSALSHPLVLRADAGLQAVANAAGYPEDLQRRLIEGVHVRLVERFRAVISDGKVKEKFDPLFRLMELGGKEVSTYATIRRHIDYQLWRFRKAPALGKDGTLSVRCPLQDIFEPLDCGVLTWGAIRLEEGSGSPRVQRLSPFKESFGGRTPLLGHVIGLIGDRELDDAIIVQGTAGAGKSAFTLQLCAELTSKSLRPIRIRMRDLSLDPRISLLDDIALALTQNSGDDDFDADAGPRPSSADLDLSHILGESVRFGDASISPFIFIFDGWDEISISASEGFRIRIEKTLDAVRRQLLSGHAHRVRVILTGRPSVDVNEAKFLRDRTPVLTVRPFTQPQLDHFVDKLIQHRVSTLSERRLPSGTSKRIAALKKQFDEDTPGSDGGDQSILGLPLLALLAVWLVLNDENPPDDVTSERTSLYRRLVDLTTRHGGNIEQVNPAAPKITGNELRDLLQRTAAAMTLRGTEHISYNELMLRLEAGGLNDVETVVGRAVVESEVAKLMLSFFFNTGSREHGCEFIHKSFREYLFSEAIVEALKRGALAQGQLLSRSIYWKDFEDGNPLRILVDELGLLLGPQWISKDVGRHIAWLLSWEVGRSVSADSAPTRLEETPSLTIAEWKAVRDRLAELWDWWAEGVHLRPQPYRPKGRSDIIFDPPYVVRLAQQISPPDVQRGALPEPVRTTTLDAHLGDALFRLNCALHFEINKATGWLAPIFEDPSSPSILWLGAESAPPGGRRYQTHIRRGDSTWLAFAPSSPDGGVNHYIANYIARINSAGWRPEYRFPCLIDMAGVDLRGADISAQVFAMIQFNYARLSEVNLSYSVILACKFFAVTGISVVFDHSRLIYSDLSSGEWPNATFNNCSFEASEGPVLTNTKVSILSDPDEA
jgi:hypothetical protein